MIKKNINHSPWHSNKYLAYMMNCFNSCKNKRTCLVKLKSKWKKGREIRDMKTRKKKLRSKSVTGILDQKSGNMKK